MPSKERILAEIEQLRSSLPGKRPQDGEAWIDTDHGGVFELTKKGEVGGTQHLRLVVRGSDALRAILDDFKSALGEPQRVGQPYAGSGDVTIVFWDAFQVAQILGSRISRNDSPNLI